MQATPSFRPVWDRNHVGRYVAALCGVVALACFYQPWVSGTLPAIGASRLTGLELARGVASDRVDEAAFGKGASTSATAAAVAVANGSSASAGSSAAAAGSGAGTLGGLTLPTRIPTVAAGGNVAQAPVISGATVTAGAGAALGGLTLPTRIPTTVPGAQASGAVVPAAAASPGPGTPVATAVQTGVPVVQELPDHLPQMPLYAVPLAAIGVAIFSLIWDRLRDARDRRFGKWWTIVFAFAGTLQAGFVLYKVSTAPSNNDLLAPGAARGVEWGLWATFLAFVLCAASITVSWIGVRTQPAEPS